jgi:hypothetical protein
MVMANLGYFELFCNLVFSKVFFIENFLFTIKSNRKLIIFLHFVRLRFELLSGYAGCHKVELSVSNFDLEIQLTNTGTETLKIAKWTTTHF